MVGPSHAVHMAAARWRVGRMCARTHAAGARLDGCDLGGRAPPVLLFVARPPQDVPAVLPPPDRGFHRVPQVEFAILVALDVRPVELVFTAAGPSTRRAIMHGGRCVK